MIRPDWDHIRKTTTTCSCGASLDTMEKRFRHWDDGHFDFDPDPLPEPTPEVDLDGYQMTVTTMPGGKHFLVLEKEASNRVLLAEFLSKETAELFRRFFGNEVVDLTTQAATR